MVKLVLISRYRFKGDWTPLSGAIKLATNCKWHHCLFIWDGWCYEAVPSGVKRTISEVDFNSKIGVHYDAISKDVTHLVDIEKLKERLGNKYDFLALPLHLSNQTSFGWIQKKARDNGKDTCGSFCAHALGYKEPYKIDPQDLYRDYFKH